MLTSVVNLDQIKLIQDFRIDAECFKPIHLKKEKLISESKHTTIQSASKSVINFGAYSLCNYIEFLDKGTPFIVTEDIRNNIIDTTNLHHISQSVHKILYKSHCKKGQVLLTMAGAYLGQAAVYYHDFDASSNQAIAKISLKPDSVDPYYLSTFLNSEYGQSQIERFRTGTGQPNLNLGLIQSIKVPLLDSSFQEQIKELVLKGINLFEHSHELFKKAENDLLNKFGLVDWRPNRDLWFVKNYSDTRISERIDSEYYQPQFEEIVNVIRAFGSFAALDDLVNIKKCVEPGRDAYQESGITFLRVSNLSKFGINPTNQQFISEDLYNELSSYQPKQGEILVTKDATPGIAYYIKNTPDKMIPSGGILRLAIKNKNEVVPEYLTLVINSMLVQKQIERDSGGSIINHWLVDQVKETVIPILDYSDQESIANTVSNSFSDRETAINLLNLAKSAVENAIESGTKSASHLINDELKKWGVVL